MVAPSCVELEVTAAYEPVSGVLIRRRSRFRVLGLQYSLSQIPRAEALAVPVRLGNCFCWDSLLKRSVITPSMPAKKRPRGRAGQSSPSSSILAAGYVVKALREIFSKVFLVYTDPACSGSPSFVVVTVPSFDIKSW